MKPWQIAEQEFDDYWNQRGWVYKFEDAAALYGKNKGVVANDPKPSDRIVVTQGFTFFAEVKSTEHKDRFQFSLIRKGQKAAARMALKHGGAYFFYVKRLSDAQWFAVPGKVVIGLLLNGIMSIRFAELEQYKTSIKI